MKQFDLLETGSEDQVMQDLNPDKMSTEDLQKMLAELKGVANAQMAKPEEDAAKKQALAAAGQTMQSLQAEAADTEEEELTGAEKKAHETKVREEGLSAVLISTIRR